MVERSYCEAVQRVAEAEMPALVREAEYEALAGAVEAALAGLMGRRGLRPHVHVYEAASLRNLVHVSVSGFAKGEDVGAHAIRVSLDASFPSDLPEGELRLRVVAVAVAGVRAMLGDFPAARKPRARRAARSAS